MRILVDGREDARSRTQKANWLLAMLALRPGAPATRERLIDLFWPDLDLDAARDNLSTTLSMLRRAFGAADHVLRANRLEVWLEAGAFTTDVIECDQLLRQAASSRDAEEHYTLLERAIDLLRGDLLPGCYEDWALGEQRRWQERRASALLDWATLLEARGHIEEALAAGARAAAADPDREEICQARMRLLARQGRVPAALDLYRDLERRLREEMQVAPSSATAELAEQLRREPDSFRLPAVSAATEGTALSTPPSAPEQIPEPAESALALPLNLTRFVGRETELDRLTALLTGPIATASRQTLRARSARLVTLLGPGGVGKTRLAIEAARQAAFAFPDGVRFVSLAELPDARLIPNALADALEAPPSPQLDPLEQSLLCLEGKRCLLILDNFEHLLQGEPASCKGDFPLPTSLLTVRLLLERVPGLVCLVTSRQVLGLDGEQEFPVSPLPLPGAERSTPAALDASPSVALYVERARAVLPDFDLTPRNRDAVVALCRRLEGMPLAIEMAAAWVRTLPPARMLEHLKGRITKLTDRRRDLPARQRSLSAAIEWSYDLLEPDLRLLYARLAVFRRGWTLEAAEAVCADPPGLAAQSAPELAAVRSALHPSSFIPDPSGIVLDPSEILDLLTGLVEKSLVVFEEREEAGRYRMLEPQREYAAEKLAESGTRLEMVRRHIAYFRDLARETVRSPAGVNPVTERALQMEKNNLRAALDGCREIEDVESELRLVVALKLYWAMSGLLSEGRRRLQEALSRPGAQERTALRANALQAEGSLAQIQNDQTIARRRFEEALEIQRERDDRAGITTTLSCLGWLARVEGRIEEARALFEEALAGYRALGRRHGVAQCLGNLGVVAFDQQDYATARERIQECISIYRALEGHYHVAAYLGVLGDLESIDNRLQPARACLEEALTIQRDTEDRSGMICTLLPLGALRRKLGDEEMAEAHLCEAIELSREMGIPGLLADGLELLALLWRRRRPEQSVLLASTVQAQRAALNLLRSATEEYARAALLSALQAELPPEAFETAFQRGALLTLAQAADHALARANDV